MLETYICDDCGEIGRQKESVLVEDALAYYCHDEEKSCYLYVMNQLQTGLVTYVRND